MGTQVGALARELGRCGPAMIQTHAADLAGELAEKLSQKPAAGWAARGARFAPEETPIRLQILTRA